MFVASFRAANSFVGKSEWSLSVDFLDCLPRCCLLLKVSNILMIGLSLFPTSLTRYIVVPIFEAKSVVTINSRPKFNSYVIIETIIVVKV